MTTKVTDEEMSVNLAIYMERVDNYIASQTAINESINATLSNMNTQMDDINDWRSKVYGAKSGLMAVAFLVMHTTAVLASFAAITKWIN